MFAKKERRGNIRKRPAEAEEEEEETGKSAVVQVRRYRGGVQPSVRRSLGCERKTLGKTALTLHLRERERSCRVALQESAHTRMNATECGRGTYLVFQ